MGFVFNNKDPLTETLNELDSYFDIGNLKEQTVRVSNLDDRVLALKKIPLDNELKCEIMNEYSAYKNAKSVKEEKKIEKRLLELLEKNDL